MTQRELSAESPPGPPRGSGQRSRWRVVILSIVVVGAVLGATAELTRAWHARTSPHAAAIGVAGVQAATEARTAPEGSKHALPPQIMFRSEQPGPGLGHLASVPRDRATGPRTVHPQLCDRVYAQDGRVACLSLQPGLTIASGMTVLDSHLQTVRRHTIDGVISRTRLSRDGTLVATTTFVTGHGYSGDFSTRTGILDLVTGAEVPDLETFRLVVDGEAVEDRSRNIWGVTFEPGPRPDGFYATAKVSGTTWLVRGSRSGRTLTAIRRNVECPSLSPDGHTLAYKFALPDGAGWRLHALDLASGQDWALPETRSIDDQVEWLDDQHILYGLQRSTEITQHSDVWVSALHTGSPHVLIPDAWSPTVLTLEPTPRYLR